LTASATAAHERLRQVIEAEHGCKASFFRSVAICELRKGRAAAQARIPVFDLAGHSSADRAYVRFQESREERDHTHPLAAVLRIRRTPVLC
jgi:hypothetical protein